MFVLKSFYLLLSWDYQNIFKATFISYKVKKKEAWY